MADLFKFLLERLFWARFCFYSEIMKIISHATFFVCLNALALQAQQTNQINPIDALRVQMRQMQESFDRVQREQKKQIEALTKKLDELMRDNPAISAKPAEAGVAETKATNGEQKKLEEQSATELNAIPATNAPAAASAASLAKPWSPSQPIPVMRAGSAYMNVSFDALIDAGWSTAQNPGDQLQLGDHDPSKRGFSLRNAEIALDGAVDPYFKGFANLVYKLDNNNETSVELEETYLVSTDLPANLQLKGGQFFANFGRNNSQHPHTWAFVDAPLMLTRAFGPDGLRSIGAQLSWLAPTPFYVELLLGVFDGQGGTASSFRNPGAPDPFGANRFHGRQTFDRIMSGPADLVYTPRVSSSFDLSDTQTLIAGASGAFGPNETGMSSRTEIYGADIYWKWKSSNANEGFPFVSWQTEGLYQRYGANADPTAPGGSLPSENLRDYGFYSQVLWGFQPHWVTGLRGEYVTGNSGAYDAKDVFRGERYRIAPVLTWYPSEFSKIRLQYNYDHGEYFGDAHSVWLQVEFLLSAHGAHKF